MDKNKLMAYLYDELSQEERQKVEQYLADNPEEKAELDELAGLRSLLESLEDKAVEIPTFVIPEREKETKQRHIFPKTRRLLSVAAVIAVLLMFGASLANMSISYKSNELRIAFGKIQNEKIESDTKPSQFQIRPDKESAEIIQQLSDLQKAIKVLEKEKNADKTQLSQEDLLALAKSIKAENLKIINQMTTLASEQQQDYTEKLLVSFAKYVEKQRQEDLINIDYNLNTLQENTEILAKIIEEKNEKN